MGSGGSLEAEYTLKGPVPAGAYHVICDAIIIRAVDVKFELLLKRGEELTELASWQAHFDPLGAGNFDAQAYELDVEAPAIDPKDGDQFVFRYSGLGSTSIMAFIPNGDGARKNGRMPNITFPR